MLKIDENLLKELFKILPKSGRNQYHSLKMKSYK